MTGRQILGLRPANHALVILGEEAGEKPRYGSRGNKKEIAEKPALEPVAMGGGDTGKEEEAKLNIEKIQIYKQRYYRLNYACN
jgi:hypothetical protein